jgi:hypothetical protein
LVLEEYHEDIDDNGENDDDGDIDDDSVDNDAANVGATVAVIDVSTCQKTTTKTKTGCLKI